MKTIELKAIKETTEDYEVIEERIKKVFRKMLYFPLLRELNLDKSTLQNSKSPLLDAVQSGELTYTGDRFRGKLNAQITKELKSLGAVWDKKEKVFRIPNSLLPADLRMAIKLSMKRFEEKFKKLDSKIRQNLPDEISANLKTADIFDKVLWKTDRDLQSSLRNITVSPKLSKEQREKIAEEWQDNMDLWIKDFAKEEIVKLRKDISKSVLAGDRRKSIADSIKKSYGVTENKAKFLARQETSLMMAKFKETRYTAAGVREYKWGCVAGSPNHPVRPWHKALEGKIFTWDKPPITTAPGEAARHNNPGQDYNCRCFAKPVVRFK